MNYLLLIIIVVVVGYAVFAVWKKENIIFGQMKRKRENKEKILEFLEDNEKIANNNVEKICKVSHATAERYLNQLEKDGELTQHGKIGQNVFYTLK